MAFRQDFICCICKDPQKRMKPDEATFEHEDLRGLGGSRRDDRIEKVVNGQLICINGAAHGWCNAKKGSRRT
jgi:hypothetical protein